MYPIIKENFTSLLCTGAFGIPTEDVKPMSIFKWDMLLDAAKCLGVESYIMRGMYSYYKTTSSMPVEIPPFEDLKKEDFDCGDATFYGLISARRYRRIIEEERHSIDTSVESLHLLSLIIKNANLLIVSDLSLSGIIAVGEYLRKKGDKVDFVKLNNWIDRLGIREVSSFIGTLLVNLFDFDKDEVEFIVCKYHNPITHYNRLLEHSLEEKHRFPLLSLMNISLFETMSYYFSNALSGILNVEE